VGLLRWREADYYQNDAMNAKARYAIRLSVATMSVVVGLFGAALFAQTAKIEPVTTIDKTEVVLDGVATSTPLAKIRLEQTVAWDGASPVPLSVDDAAVLAKKVATRFADSASLELSMIELKRAHMSNHWFYAVTFERRSSPQNGRLIPFRIIVLFDRSVVSP
jgi:hypothetical protein